MPGWKWALFFSGLQGCIFGSCFVGSTRVLTPRGWRRVDSLQPGDPVYSWDPDTRAVVSDTIRDVLCSQTGNLFRVEAGELALAGVTAEHPVWSCREQCWVPVGDLAEGDLLLATLDGAETRTVHVTRLERLAVDTTVYDLVVTRHACFFAEGLLVHNKEYVIDDDRDGVQSSWDCDDHDPAVQLCDTGESQETHDTANDDTLTLGPPEVTPSTLRACETDVLTIEPLRGTVSAVGIYGPSNIVSPMWTKNALRLQVVAEVPPDPESGSNDVVIDLEDGERLVLENALVVEGSLCD